MFKFFKSDPIKKKKKEYERLTTQAFHAQRNGDIRSYSLLTFQAEEIKKQIDMHATQDG